MFSDLTLLFASSPAAFAGAGFFIGLVVGSFLNVVIYRLPIMLDREWRTHAAEFFSADARPVPDDVPAHFTLSVPGSACPACKAPIRAWQNVPVLSWLLLRGRCAGCQSSISIRYPLVELLTATLSAWAAWHFGFGPQAFCAILVIWALIALTGIDIDHQLLPDSITLPLLWLGLLAAVVIGGAQGQAVPVKPSDAILGAVGGYMSLWLVFQAFRLITGKEGMGYGDFKLFAALGAWLGWKMLPLVILIAAASGAVLGVLLIMLQGRDRAKPIPFGPYLAVAGWLGMLYGDQLVNGYLRLSGLQH